MKEDQFPVYKVKLAPKIYKASNAGRNGKYPVCDLMVGQGFFVPGARQNVLYNTCKQRLIRNECDIVITSRVGEHVVNGQLKQGVWIVRTA